MQFQCSGYLEPRWEKHCAAFAFSLSHCFQHSCFTYISASLLLPLPFFCFSLFTVITMWWVPGCPCVGAHCWVVGIAGHGSVFLSRGWLMTVEAPGRIPGTHFPLSSIQLLIHDIQSWHCSSYNSLLCVKLHAKTLPMRNSATHVQTASKGHKPPGGCMLQCTLAIAPDSWPWANYLTSN